jgi:hypothetical protein
MPYYPVRLHAVSIVNNEKAIAQSEHIVNYTLAFLKLLTMTPHFSERWRLGKNWKPNMRMATENSYAGD